MATNGVYGNSLCCARTAALRQGTHSVSEKSVDFDVKSHQEGPEGGGGASQSKPKLLSACVLPLFEHARVPKCCRRASWDRRKALLGSSSNAPGVPRASRGTENHPQERPKPPQSDQTCGQNVLPQYPDVDNSFVFFLLKIDVLLLKT